MTRRLSILLLAVAAVAVVGLALRDDPTTRIHRVVFDLPLADRYALVTRQLEDRGAAYLFWSPDEPDETCRRLATDPPLQPAPAMAGICSYRSDGDVSLLVTVDVAQQRGGSLVWVVAEAQP